MERIICGQSWQVVVGQCGDCCDHTLCPGSPGTRVTPFAENMLISHSRVQLTLHVLCVCGVICRSWLGAKVTALSGGSALHGMGAVGTVGN